MTLASAISLIGSMQSIRESSARIQAWETILSEILSRPTIAYEVTSEDTAITEGAKK